MPDLRLKPPWTQLVIALLLAAITWTAVTVIDHGARLAAQEARMVTLERWLERVEGKLDRVLERSR